MPRWPGRCLLVLLILVAGGCATLQRLAQLPQLDFHIDGVSDPQLAGVDLTSIRSVEDLRPGDFLRIAAAARTRRLPLRFDLHLGVDNPSVNRYDLRLERLEWTLLLEGRETVSGVFARELVIAAGGTTDVPISVEVDLVRFFEDGASDLAALALRAAGAGGPTNVTLRARPTVRTPFGSFRFPNEITVASRER